MTYTAVRPHTTAPTQSFEAPSMPATARHNPAARFWDRWAERYSRSTIADQESYEKKLEITQTYFTPESNVVEFGCGTGSTAIVHAPFVKHIHATDVSSKMIEIAQHKCAAMSIDNITFEQKTLDEMNLPDESIDVVMGMSILHLLEDRDSAIATAYRMLKPGGVFISSTACLTDSHNWLRFLMPIGKFLRLMPSVEFFSQTRLEQQLIDAGFKIEKSWLPGKGKAVFCVARKP